MTNNEKQIEIDLSGLFASEVVMKFDQAMNKLLANPSKNYKIKFLLNYNQTAKDTIRELLKTTGTMLWCNWDIDANLIISLKTKKEREEGEIC